uniref:S1 motif domain-containing protein n=1 Tax=Trichogramma kaykai TaxID=54128 RepID=A0ABD2X610_9HYME
MELFPTETCRPIYYLPYKESKKFGGKNAKGCLYNYYNDIREEFTEAGWITEKEKKTSNNNKSTHLCPESFFDHDDILCNTNSQTDRTDDLKIGKKWNECFDHRLKQLSIVYKDKDGATTLAITQQHYVDHYKCLKSPLSTALLIEDYEKIITLLINNNKEKEDALVISSDILNKNFFENKWPDIAKKIFQYCKASRIKDISTLKESNKNIFSGVPDQHKTSLALYLLPYCLTLSKKITVDGIETSVNKSDQCLSFILHIEKEEDLDAKLKEFQNKLDALKLDTHPIYVLCGPLKRLEKSFLVIHDTKFKYLNIKKGFDIYFKCMLALRAWPFICDHVWSFVQQYVYDLPNDSSLFLVNKIYLPVDTLNVRLKGIKEECVFNRVNNFHVIDNYSFDMMHDILEGVCSYTLHAVFNHYIFDEKVFSLKTLNERIKNFDCNGQQCNRPPPITTNRLKTQPTLKMSAAETLFVVRYIQLMIGDLIDKKDEHWTLLKLLRQIVDIVTSDRIVKETPLLLVDYVQDFNKLYVKLFQELKPKFHFLLHYGRLLTDYGPCVHYSTMRFESRHRPIKSISFSSNCKKNLLHSITVKQKLRLLEVIHNTQLETTNLSDLDNDKNSFQSNLNDIVINGRKYQIGSFIAVDITKSEVTIGKIEQIVTVNGKTYFSLQMYEQMAFSSHYHAYIEDLFPGEFIDGCVAAQNERNAIALVARDIRSRKLAFKIRHGVDFIPGFSPEILAAHTDHQTICEKEKEIRSLCRAYYDKYGIIYARSRHQVEETLKLM